MFTDALSDIPGVHWSPDKTYVFNLIRHMYLKERPKIFQDYKQLSLKTLLQKTSSVFGNMKMDST